MTVACPGGTGGRYYDGCLTSKSVTPSCSRSIPSGGPLPWPKSLETRSRCSKDITATEQGLSYTVEIQCGRTASDAAEDLSRFFLHVPNLCFAGMSL